MLTLHITNDDGFDDTIVVKPRNVLVFERATGITLGQFGDGSMEMIYKLAHFMMKMRHSDETPAKLEEFEETFDVQPVEESADPTPAAP